MNKSLHFDVIIIGAGHAGIESAAACARLGSKTLLITTNKLKIGLMPCNPAIGGIGKGHIVFEISALGGVMPKLCTQTYVQARMLNTKKGPAVQGLRLQIDSLAYQKAARDYLEKIPNLTIKEGMVDALLVDHAHVQGIQLGNEHYYSTCVVITTGTFLNGYIHVGDQHYPAGRRDEPSSTSLANNLAHLGFQMGRLKTGTPPRLLTSSIDFSRLLRQEAHQLHYLFEFEPHRTKNTKDCYITSTNEKTHRIINENLHLSSLNNGGITTLGPRYCPSIEVKIERFSNKTSHQIFVEPEGNSGQLMYPNGLSNALPIEIQEEFIKSIEGFEKAIIAKPGYAIEYDFVFPTQLKHTLETKTIEGLFLAGQINGTTGYEEAAGQGIIAGINASLKSQHKEPFILSRDEAYIGVMIDDLVTSGIDEPYRMFTSRAERRLLLRQDNVFYRLGPKAYSLGLIDERLLQQISYEKKQIDDAISMLFSKHKIQEFIKYEDNKLAYLANLTGYELSERALLSLSAEIHYAPYLERELKEIEKAQKLQTLIIPENFPYKDLPGLSKELQEKLNKYKPSNIAQAMRVQGMTPAAISLLIFKVHDFEKTLKLSKIACNLHA